MPFHPHKHHRRSIRLRGYDYALEGAYFVTICTQDRQHLFGRIVNGKLKLNPAGEMVAGVWMNLPQYYPTAVIDEFVVMPDHFHGVVVIRGAETPSKFSFTDLMQRFKSFTTRAYSEGVSAGQFKPFCGRFWQRNYYERIIRDDVELERKRHYIQENPWRWESSQDP